MPTPASLSAWPDRLSLTPGLVRGLHARERPRRIPTGLRHLDKLLDGGLPRGVVTELVGVGSSGRTALAYALAATVTSAGEVGAWIDLPDTFDPAGAEAAGISLARLLWVRPRDVRAALRAAEHVSDAGGFSFVLVDLADPRIPNLTVPAAGWLRLARAAARGCSALVTMGVRRSAGMFATLCLETERRCAHFTGSGGPCPLFDGMAGTVHLRKNKLGPPGTIAARFCASTLT